LRFYIFFQAKRDVQSIFSGNQKWGAQSGAQSGNCCLSKSKCAKLIQWKFNLGRGLVSNAPGKYLHTLKCCAIGGAQWQLSPTGRGAQFPRNALKQLLKNQGAQWSHIGTVNGKGMAQNQWEPEVLPHQN